MLFIWFDFPSGKYIAAQHDAGSKPEWPPHPARAFSALVAAAYNLTRETSPGATDLPESYRLALEWVESAKPPAIWCPEADLVEAPISYVPVNDAKSRFNSKKKSHPIHAIRQPRHFPSANLLGHATVGFGWEQSPNKSAIKILGDIASRVTRLGTSHSFAIARVETVAPESPAAFAPSVASAVFLRVPMSGRLAELDKQYALAGQSSVRRPAPAFEPIAGYKRVSDSTSSFVESQYETIVLRLKGISWYAADSVSLARAVRAAVMSVLGDAAPPAVHGHDPTIAHVGWLPLPDVGHPHAKGRIVGIAILIPRLISSTDRGLILAALTKMPFVRVPRGRQVLLSTLRPGEPVPIALRHETWCRSSHIFESVTPIILDRPPKRKSPDAMNSAAADSIVNAGYPVPKFVKTSFDSRFTGAPSAHEVRSKIPRCHVCVQFEYPLHGPLLAGRLRHFGIGVFRPVDEAE